MNREATIKITQPEPIVIDFIPRHNSKQEDRSMTDMQKTSALPEPIVKPRKKAR